MGIQHLPLIIGLRRGAVNTGAWEDSYGTKLFLTMERNGNSLGMASSERQKFIEKNCLPIYDGTQEYCLWLGCMGAYDPAGRETILALVKVLRYLEITFGVLKKEKCNGDPARRLGNDLLFTTLAEENLENIAAGQGEEDAEHLPALRSHDEHGLAGGGPDRRNRTSFRTAGRHKMRLPVAADEEREKVVYHDPCYLGRYRGVYDEPREVLERAGGIARSAAQPRAFVLLRRGRRPDVPGRGKGQAHQHGPRRGTGGDRRETVAAACPFCASMFRDALKAVTEPAAETLDIVQIAARGIDEQHANLPRKAL